MPGRRTAKLAGLAVVSLAVAAAIAELGFRSLCRRDIRNAMLTESDMYYFYDLDGTRKHFPNRVGYERSWDGEGKAEFRINSLGLRDDEIPIEKPVGETRLIMVGDSITLGEGLRREDTFVEILESMLNARGPGRFRVINAGVGDAGIREELSILNGTGLSLSPDVVVLCLYLNSSRPPLGFCEEVVYRNPVVAFLDRSRLLRRSYAASYLVLRFKRFLVNRRIASSEIMSRRFQWIEICNGHKWRTDLAWFAELVRLAKYDWGAAWIEEERAVLQEVVTEMKSLCEKKGVRFVVVEFPARPQVEVEMEDAFVRRPQVELSYFLAELGVPFLDLLNALKQYPGGGIFYDVCHYTPEGNRVVAEEILNFLLKWRLDVSYAPPPAE